MVNDGNVVERRPVTLGEAEDAMRIVEKGLRDDEWIVVGGPANVRGGDRVEPRKARRDR